MPRARHNSATHFAFAKWSTLMRADSVESRKFAVNVEYCNNAVLDSDFDGRTWRAVFSVGQESKIRHGCFAQAFWSWRRWDWLEMARSRRCRSCDSDSAASCELAFSSGDAATNTDPVSRGSSFPVDHYTTELARWVPSPHQSLDRTSTTHRPETSLVRIVECSKRLALVLCLTARKARPLCGRMLVD